MENLLHEFFNSTSDACPLECTQQEELELAFSQWVKTNKMKDFESVVKPAMQYLADNHHPHKSIHLNSTTAELLEGQQVFKTDDFLVD